MLVDLNTRNRTYVWLVRCMPPLIYHRAPNQSKFVRRSALHRFSLSCDDAIGQTSLVEFRMMRLVTCRTTRLDQRQLLSLRPHLRFALQCSSDHATTLAHLHRDYHLLRSPELPVNVSLLYRCKEEGESLNVAQVQEPSERSMGTGS
jgi:hypothetical protein